MQAANAERHELDINIGSGIRLEHAHNGCVAQWRTQSLLIGEKGIIALQFFLRVTQANTIIKMLTMSIKCYNKKYQLNLQAFMSTLLVYVLYFYIYIFLHDRIKLKLCTSSHQLLLYYLSRVIKITKKFKIPTLSL